MARHIEDEVEYYYDSHPTEEDLMGETSFHADLVIYLLDVLRWLFRGRVCAIYDNLNFYQTTDPQEYPIAPDIAIITGIAHRPTRSWRVGKSGPAPQVVFEIASEETWKKDLTEKPGKYADMGVQEYFAYDPNEPLLSRRANRRLFGWRLDQSGRSMRVMQPRPDGSLWSPSLESWLVPDQTRLRLYDHLGQMRLTHAEFADQQADHAMQQVDLAMQQADFAMQQAEAEAKRSHVYAEKLRSLGIDPDQLI
jgi:Uma2 family endonuclease